MNHIHGISAYRLKVGRWVFLGEWTNLFEEPHEQILPLYEEVAQGEEIALASLNCSGKLTIGEVGEPFVAEEIKPYTYRTTDENKFFDRMTDGRPKAPDTFLPATSAILAQHNLTTEPAA